MLANTEIILFWHQHYQREAVSSDELDSYLAGVHFAYIKALLNLRRAANNAAKAFSAPLIEAMQKAFDDMKGLKN